jgi:hypothetical protein
LLFVAKKPISVFYSCNKRAKKSCLLKKVKKNSHFSFKTPVGCVFESLKFADNKIPVFKVKDSTILSRFENMALLCHSYEFQDAISELRLLKWERLVLISLCTAI